MSGDPKSEAATRTLPVEPAVRAVIKDYLRRRGTYLAEPPRAEPGTPVRPSALSRHVRGAVKRAGVDSKGGCHELRRTVRDELLAKGVDVLLVSRWLGHGDGGRLVANVYAGPQADRLAQVELGLGQ